MGVSRGGHVEEHVQQHDIAVEVGEPGLVRVEKHVVRKAVSMQADTSRNMSRSSSCRSYRLKRRTTVCCDTLPKAAPCRSHPESCITSSITSSNIRSFESPFCLRRRASNLSTRGKAAITIPPAAFLLALALV